MKTAIKKVFNYLSTGHDFISFEVNISPLTFYIALAVLLIYKYFFA